MKSKGFASIELMVVILTIFLLVALIVPARKKAQKLQELTENTVIIKDGAALVTRDQLCKIELKPAFTGKNVEVYLSYIPDTATIITENDKYYLLWKPTSRKVLKTTLITAAPNLTKEQEIMIFVK